MTKMQTPHTLNIRANDAVQAYFEAYYQKNGTYPALNKQDIQQRLALARRQIANGGGYSQMHGYQPN